MASTVLYPPGDTCYAFHQHNPLSRATPLAYHNYFGYLQPQFSYTALVNYPRHQYYYPQSPIMTQPSPAEMDDFQRLSDDYRAELPGPLIGEKLPMSVLATEYAQADPTYVVKTAALARNYSAYRTVKGDGQCGWRGTVFGYFDTLLNLGDVDLVLQERVRLQSFEDTMRMAGIDYDIIVDMFDYTWELFDDLQRAVERQDKSDSVILASLNDTNKSDSIVYHFKMMTSAFMQLRADYYEPFLEVPIADYRVSRIDPSNQEIDQIGLQALTDAVIAPANFALEVLYLDRSSGEEVTPHPFVAEYIGKPTIRLLYRPGHYDMIYKDEQPVQVFLQRETLIPQTMEMADSSVSGDLQAYLFSGPQAANASTSQTDSFYSVDHGSNPPTTNASANHFFYSAPQTLYYMSPHQPQPLAQPMPLLNIDFPPSYPMSYSGSCSPEVSSPLQPTTPILPAHPSPPPPSKLQKRGSEPQIRLNANCFNYQLRHSSVPLCSQTYGSAAVLSTAHFRNQDFQPQMWIAEEEYMKP